MIVNIFQILSIIVIIMQKYAQITDLQNHKNSFIVTKYYYTIIRVHRSVFSIYVYKSPYTTKFCNYRLLFYRSVTTVK